MQWGIRWAGLAAICGYLAYLYLMLGFPGSATLIQANGTVAIALISVLGVVLGWGIAGIWWLITQKQINAIK
jgi:hypothetical protein